VHDVLYPSPHEQENEDDSTAANKRRVELLERELIASDVAFATWLGRQQGVRWPWTYSDTPENAARHRTRDLWFWSRQVAQLRAEPTWTAPQVPTGWQPCDAPLKTGTVHSFDLHQGLLSLAQMLSAGHVIAPWRLGLEINDFADSFDNDMGYIDAFRLWGMSAFDDHEHLQRYLELEPSVCSALIRCSASDCVAPILLDFGPIGVEIPRLCSERPSERLGPPCLSSIQPGCG
jgi:hypothetical protein